MRDPNPGETDHIEVGRLKCRADFVRVGKGRRWHGKAMTVQVASQAIPQDQVASPDGVSETARVGFTLTRKVGSSVVRNRARRRLREAVRLADNLPVHPGHDYVIVGRIDAIRLPFAELRRELDRAIRSAHGAKRGESRPRPERTRPST